MDLILGILLAVLTYIVFFKVPAKAPMIVWSFTAGAVVLNLGGYVGNSFVYGMAIFLIFIMMITAVMEART